MQIRDPYQSITQGYCQITLGYHLILLDYFSILLEYRSILLEYYEANVDLIVGRSPKASDSQSEPFGLAVRRDGLKRHVGL